MARERVKKFGALVGMIAITGMLVLFFLAMPSFVGSTAGVIFSLIWLLVALASLGAFGMKVFQRKEKRRVGLPRNERSYEHAVPSMGHRQRQRGISY